MREMITAASAAGVAVAFGSPIGGVLFSIEVKAVLIHKLFESNTLSMIGNEPYLQHQNYVEEFLLCASRYCNLVCT